MLNSQGALKKDLNCDQKLVVCIIICIIKIKAVSYHSVDSVRNSCQLKVLHVLVVRFTVENVCRPIFGQSRRHCVHIKYCDFCLQVCSSKFRIEIFKWICYLICVDGIRDCFQIYAEFTRINMFHSKRQRKHFILFVNFSIIFTSSSVVITSGCNISYNSKIPNSFKIPAWLEAESWKGFSRFSSAAPPPINLS